MMRHNNVLPSLVSGMSLGLLMNCPSDTVGLSQQQEAHARTAEVTAVAEAEKLSTTSPERMVLGGAPFAACTITSVTNTGLTPEAFEEKKRYPFPTLGIDDADRTAITLRIQKPLTPEAAGLESKYRDDDTIEWRNPRIRASLLRPKGVQLPMASPHMSEDLGSTTLEAPVATAPFYPRTYAYRIGQRAVVSIFSQASTNRLLPYTRQRETTTTSGRTYCGTIVLRNVSGKKQWQPAPNTPSEAFAPQVQTDVLRHM